MVIENGIYRDQKLNQTFTIITYCFAGFSLCVIVDWCLAIVMLSKIVKTYKPFFPNDNSMQMMILVILFKVVEKQPSQAYWQSQNVFKTQSSEWESSGKKMHLIACYY